MNMHTHAAEQRAIRGITDLLADSHYTAETAGHAAEGIMAQLAADGWHHTSAHGAAPEPPRQPDPPNAEWRRARTEIARKPHARSAGHADYTTNGGHSGSQRRTDASEPNQPEPG